MRACILEKKVVMDGGASPFCYYAWPTVARMQDGRLALAASGHRLAHVCPFGKGVMRLSEDEGNTWSPVQTVMDTPLDDRDSGITAFGKGRVIFTSFNNTTAFQRKCNEALMRSDKPGEVRKAKLIESYLNYAEATEGFDRYLGSTYRISEDGLKTFGEIKISPVTSPHGPLALNDGTLLYIGRRFTTENERIPEGKSAIACMRLNDKDEFEFVSEISDISDAYGDVQSHEPHAIQTKSGKIIVHIRAERAGDRPLFTVYQSVSEDGGKTFSKPVQLLSDFGGSPAHLVVLPDGTLLSVYGYRLSPYGIRYMISKDDGKTWDCDHVLYDGGESGDLGYPATVVLTDGTLFTVYYENRGGVSKIYGIRWRLDN